MDTDKKICGICGEQKEIGIHLYTLFICSPCEQEMIHTDPSDQRYRYFLKKLRAVNQSTQYS